MLYFFDIDGTLVAPRFKDNDKMVIGFDDATYEQYCLDHTKDGYDNCVIVKPVFDYATKLKKEGHMIFIITGIGSEAELEMKHAFFKKKGLIYGDGKVYTRWVDKGEGDYGYRKRGFHHPNPGSVFLADFYTDFDNEKIKTIKYVAEYAKVPVSDCVLIDDTFDLLLRAKYFGIKAIHPSNIITNSVSE